MKELFDVTVVGGGTAGVVAALQAARAGCKTLLVERSASPGGTVSGAMIAFSGLFFAWKKQIIAGIGWELVTECAALSGSRLPKFEEQNGLENHPAYQVRFNPALYAMLCDEKMTGANVRRMYHTLLASASFTASGEWNLALCGISGMREVRTRILIDCTGDASASALAGFEREIIRDPQPCTLSCHVSGYDPAQLDYNAIAAAADESVRKGELRYTDLGWNCNAFSAHFLSCRGDNGNHVWETEPADPDGRSRLEIDARASLLRAWRFLRRQKGLEHLSLDQCASECGVRESAVIRGEHKITIQEYLDGVRYPDAVSFAFYPVDLHRKDEHGVEPRPLNAGIVPSVPLRALIPRGSRNLLAAGRCVSSDRLANSALRVQAASMADGQAAGAAAALAVQSARSPLDTDLADLKTLLRRHGAIVPD